MSPEAVLAAEVSAAGTKRPFDVSTFRSFQDALGCAAGCAYGEALVSGRCPPICVGLARSEANRSLRTSGSGLPVHLYVHVAVGQPTRTDAYCNSLPHTRRAEILATGSRVFARPLRKSAVGASWVLLCVRVCVCVCGAGEQAGRTRSCAVFVHFACARVCLVCVGCAP